MRNGNERNHNLKKKKFNILIFKGKKIWESGDVRNGRVVSHHEVRRKQKRSTAQNQGEIDRYILVEKWIGPLTEATVYPDTIWRERERNGEIK